MQAEELFAYSLMAIFVVPFFVGIYLLFLWYKTLFMLHYKVKKTYPDLAIKFFPFFKPRNDSGLLTTYLLSFKVIWHELSFGFLSKKKTNKLFDEIFNIVAIGNTKNPELIKLIEELKRVYTFVSYWFMGYIVYILVISFLVIIIFKLFQPFS
jgi:hypothetical protein